ncbi:YncE family protein [Myroides fluvii]|uniref:YncE family protein n=1 Tax=Myroides fluvii TaxID=2572594 RepID=UPI001E37E614|nr:hypothetical protein [Myroides fluvii]
MKKLLFLALSLSILSTSCSTSDDPFVEVPQVPNLDNGLLILNQGGLAYNDASIGFSSFAYDKYHANIAQTADRALGDGAQSMAFKDNKAFVVLKGSNKVEIFNRYTFKHEGTITEGLNKPLSIAFANNKVYVTNEETQTVSVYDSNYQFLTLIKINAPVGQILAWHTKVYVQKNISADKSEIVVVDEKFNIIKSIPVQKELKDFVTLGDFIFAVSSTADKSFFYKIDAQTDEKVTEFFSTRNTAAKNLRVDNNDMYYTSNNAVYKWNPHDTNVQVAPVLTIPEKEYIEASTFYGFNVIKNTIYVGDAGDMLDPSTVHVYQNGQKVSSFTAGILTKHFYANYK